MGNSFNNGGCMDDPCNPPPTGRSDTTCACHCPTTPDNSPRWPPPERCPCCGCTGRDCECHDEEDDGDW